MKEEKYFLKKIIKGEIIEEKDLINLIFDKEFVSAGSQMQTLVESEYEIQERSDSESDKEEKKKGDYEEVKMLEKAID